MNGQTTCDKQNVKVSSPRKWEYDDEEKWRNLNGEFSGNAVEIEEDIVDPYTKKRRESLKHFVYDIAGKVRMKLNIFRHYEIFIYG